MTMFVGLQEYRRNFRCTDNIPENNYGGGAGIAAPPPPASYANGYCSFFCRGAASKEMVAYLYTSRRREFTGAYISAWHDRFSRPFSSPLLSILKMCFSISSRTALWNMRMANSRSISSLVDQFWNIVIQFRALSPVFVNCNSNSSVTVAEHETDININFVYIGIHFPQSFTQNRLPDIKAHNYTWWMWIIK